MATIDLKHINLYYKNKQLLKESCFQANSQEMVLLQGKSGCGKTTLLYALSLMSNIEGTYYLDDKCVSKLSDAKKSAIRKQQFGVVMQDCLLYEHMSVEENIRYYASLGGINPAGETIVKYMQDLHLDIQLSQKADSLSGGERQRVALICAIIKEPAILILDEPTSQLDEKTEAVVMNWLKRIKEEHNLTIVLTSHKKVDEYCDKIYVFKEKQLHLVKDNKNNQQFHHTVKTTKKMKVQVKQSAGALLKRFVLFMTIPLLFVGFDDLLSKYKDKQIDILNQSAINMICDSQFAFPSVSVEEREASLLFYLEENNINERALVSYEKNGCYLSQDFYQDFHRDMKNSSLSVAYENQQIQLPVAGILDNSSLVQQTTQDYCIYIPYEVYQAYADTSKLERKDSILELSDIKKDRIVFKEDLNTLEKAEKMLSFHKMMHMFILALYALSDVAFLYIWINRNRKSWLLKYIDGFSR